MDGAITRKNANVRKVYSSIYFWILSPNLTNEPFQVQSPIVLLNILGYMGQFCQKALCYPQCKNGGNCTAPAVCSCPKGMYGSHFLKTPFEQPFFQHFFLAFQFSRKKYEQATKEDTAKEVSQLLCNLTNTFLY